MVMDLNSMSAAALNIALICGSIMFIGGLLIVVVRIVLLQRRFNTTAIIYGKDGFGNPIMEFDQAGIYVDAKTDNKRFFLKRNKVGLDPDNVPIVYGSNNKKYVHLKRDGLKNFRYIKMDIPGKAFTVGEEDVNWAINSYQRTKKVFGETLFQKLLPYIGIAIMGVMVLGLTVVALKGWQDIMPTMVEISQNLARAAEATTGTVVIK